MVPIIEPEELMDGELPQTGGASIRRDWHLDRLTRVDRNSSDEFANKLDDLISVIDNDEIDEQKLIETSSETFDLFNLEVSWRDDANKNLLPELIKYNDVIKHNIGLRLQSRLTKEQAKFVARCNSVHRDISLNF